MRVVTQTGRLWPFKHGIELYLRGRLLLRCGNATMSDRLHVLPGRYPSNPIIPWDWQAPVRILPCLIGVLSAIQRLSNIHTS